MNRSPQKLSKRRIAEIQILRAIKVLVEDEDPVSAITLAGAAEEIIGKKLRDKGKRCAFDHAVAFGKQVLAFAAEELQIRGRSIEVPAEAELKERVNRTRNELKHKCTDKPVVAHFPDEAESMIVRALNNYVILYGRPPRQKYVQSWYEHMTL